MIVSAKLYAGHMELHDVLANVLIDKGIVSREDLCKRLQEAYQVAGQTLGDPQSAEVLGWVVHYLEVSEVIEKQGYSDRLAAQRATIDAILAELVEDGHIQEANLQKRLLQIVGGFQNN